MANQKRGDKTSEGNGAQGAEKQRKATAKETSEKTAGTARATGAGRSNRSKQSTVTFSVSLPEKINSRQQSVYLTGSFQAFNPSLPDWDARGIKMKKVDDTTWSVTVKGSPEGQVEYKYTLGSWDAVEVDGNCRDIPNRRMRLDRDAVEPQTIQDQVKNWRGQGKCAG